MIFSAVDIIGTGVYYELSTRNVRCVTKVTEVGIQDRYSTPQVYRGPVTSSSMTVTD